MKKNSLIFIFLVIGKFASAQASFIIVNNLSYSSVEVILSGTDAGYFGPSATVQESRVITVPASTGIGTDECLITSNPGWRTIPGPYTCPTIRTIIWGDAHIHITSSVCSSPGGGASNPGGCNVYGYSNPYYFCPGGEHVTWSTTTSACGAGDNVIITIDP